MEKTHIESRVGSLMKTLATLNDYLEDVRQSGDVGW